MSRTMSASALVHHVHKRFTIFVLGEGPAGSAHRYFWAYDNQDASLLAEGAYEFTIWRDAVRASNRLRIERKSMKSGGSPTLVEGAL
jgi:hypothetical protein